MTGLGEGVAARGVGREVAFVKRSPGNLTITGHGAYLLSRLVGLRTVMFERTRREGLRLPNELAELVTEIDRCADEYADALRLPTRRDVAKAPAMQCPSGHDGHGVQREVVRMLTVKETAIILKLSERQVRRLAIAGHLAARRSGNRWLIDARDVDDLLAVRDVDGLLEEIGAD